MVLHQFDYIFAISMIFAFLDAWNIGANDIANSFASSVSSRALKYWQAMIMAAICEFLGAVLVGSKVSDTIKSKIVSPTLFSEDPAVLMLLMSCALVGSSFWVTIATVIGMPVSSTHSVIGAVIGASIAAKGGNAVNWGWSGVAQIFASWFIAPLIAGAFATIVFLLSKFLVLERSPRTSLRNGMILIPILVFACFAVLTMLIVWKGSPSLNLDDLSSATIGGAIVGVAGVASILYMVFLFPFYRRKLVYEDWTLKWYDAFRGPIYYFKSTDNIPPLPENHELVIDYYKGRRPEVIKIDDESTGDYKDDQKDVNEIVNSAVSEVSQADSKENLSTREYWFLLLKQGPNKWPKLLWLILTHGLTKDIIGQQSLDNGMLGRNVKEVHAKSKFYDNKIEHLYSLLQAITAGTMSFAHGANDISNATGPLSTVYTIWKTNAINSNGKSDVPTWVLCYTAAALVIGLWTYGYRIMANLGNKLILQSPSRGFSIEIGAACATVMATQLSIPVSTTQCAVGATVFVGLCNRDLKAINWRMVIWCYLGWILTLPIAGLVAGILMGIILNAPHYGGNYQLS